MSRISIDPGIHFGKPCIAGTRITVRDVLELVDEGLTGDEIRKDYYPVLTDEDIRACIAFRTKNVDRGLISAED